MRESWRLVLDPPLPGAVNMERDMEMHREVSRGESPPVLRFYRWDPPAVSLGHFQEAKEVLEVGRCRSLGIDIVRRPTGGRALLHHRELTYSLAVREDHPLVPSSVLEAYRIFSGALVCGFAKLGIEARLAAGDKRGRGRVPGACFDSPSAYEIQIEGKKVVGSAQLRRGGALLQHGAILFRLSPEIYREVLKPPGDGGGRDHYLRSLEAGAAGLEDLGYRLQPQELAAALQAGFEESLNIDFHVERKDLEP